MSNLIKIKAERGGSVSFFSSEGQSEDVARANLEEIGYSNIVIIGEKEYEEGVAAVQPARAEPSPEMETAKANALDKTKTAEERLDALLKCLNLE